jgi:autotransporter-associated beta strand protein
MLQLRCVGFYGCGAAFDALVVAEEESMLTSHARIVRAVSAALAVAVASQSFAATLAWNGVGAAGGNPNFSSDTNWASVQVPANGDILGFGTTTNPRLPANDIVGLSLAGINISGNAYTISGSAITMTGNIAFTAGAGNASFISAPIVMTQDLTVDIAANTGSGRLELNGDISGNFALNKINPGMLRLAAVNTKTYTGDTNINGGTVDLAGGSLPSGPGKGNVIVAAGATLNDNGQNTSINGLSGAGAVNKTGSTSRSLSVGLGDANGNHTGSVSFVGGTSNIIKEGTGTQVMGGTGSMSGGFVVNGGRMIVDGTYTATSTVNANGTLGGTGTLGNVTVTGQLKPGGTLTGPVTADSTAVLGSANLTLNAASTTTLDILNLARESQYDGVDSTGAVVYGGTLNVTVASASLLGTFDLFAFGATVPTGNFAAVNVNGNALTNAAGIWTGVIGSNTYVFTQGTGDLVVTAPEPTTLAAIAGASVLGLRRRRSR